MVGTDWGAAVVVWSHDVADPRGQQEIGLVDASARIASMVVVPGVQEADLGMCWSYLPWNLESGGRLAVFAMTSADAFDAWDKFGHHQVTWKIFAVGPQTELAMWGKIAVRMAQDCRECASLGTPPISLAHVDSERVLVTWTEQLTDGGSGLRLATVDSSGVHPCDRLVAKASGHQQVQGRLLRSDDGVWLLAGWVDRKGRTPSLLLPLDGTTCPDLTMEAPPEETRRIR